jgi:hypothetical protein
MRKRLTAFMGEVPGWKFCVEGSKGFATAAKLSSAYDYLVDALEEERGLRPHDGYPSQMVFMGNMFGELAAVVSSWRARLSKEKVQIDIARWQRWERGMEGDVEPATARSLAVQKTLGNVINEAHGWRQYAHHYYTIVAPAVNVIFAFDHLMNALQKESESRMSYEGQRYLRKMFDDLREILESWRDPFCHLTMLKFNGNMLKRKAGPGNENK